MNSFTKVCTDGRTAWQSNAPGAAYHRWTKVWKY